MGAVATAAATAWGLQVAGPTGWAVGFWPAFGVVLAVLLRSPGALEARLLLTQVLAGVLSGLALGLNPGAAAVMAVSQVAGPWLAVRWLRQAGLRQGLGQARDWWLLAAAAMPGAAVVSAALAAAGLAGIRHIGLVHLPAAAASAWLASLVGLLLAAVPLLLIRPGTLAQAMSPRQRWLTLGTAVTTLLPVAVACAMPLPTPPAVPWLLLGLPPIALCWLVLRGGSALASAMALLVVAGLQSAASVGAGPLAQLTGSSSALALSAYALMLALPLVMIHGSLLAQAQREQRWQLALAGADLGVADWQLPDGPQVRSSRWRTLMGEAADADPETLNHWLDRLHDADREAVRAMLGPTAPGAPSQVNSTRRESRVRVGDSWVWLDVQLIVAERDAVGTALRVVVSLADLGERRSARAQQQLSASVFNQLNEGLLVTDGDLRVLDANPTYSRITGIPRDELIGSTPSLLTAAVARGPEGSANGLPPTALWAVLQSSGRWMSEVQHQHPDGTPGTLQLTLSTVPGPDGGPRYHVLVVSDITEQRLQRDQLERQAHFDELTGLPNRTRLAQLLAEAMAATDRDGYLLAVCYLDIDHFKQVNDRHGHAAGDRLLAELAKRMRSALRSRGTVWSDAAARLGGDEFVLLLRAGTVDEARAAVERVLRVVGQPIVLVPGAEPELVTASVGATVYPLDASDADTLLRHADHAMYGAKQAGRNGFLFFDPEHSRRTEERVLAIGRVQDALDRDELILYYQPKVDLKRGIVRGFEALLRWNHPEHGVVPPAQFLPLIEHTGLSARVGDHVLAKALDQLERWLDAGLDLSVSVNISARHLQEPDFAQRLAELLARHRRPMGPHLELEVLETAALTDIAFTSALLERCAKLGVRWALDDFGTGYSTLTYLKRLPVQVLKIDRSFVHNMLVDAQDRAIVEGVISLARTFDCVAVAEGVETAAQARMLLDMGCELGQGAGIASPMPAAEVAPWLRDWRGLFALTAAAPSAAVAPAAANTPAASPPPAAAPVVTLPTGGRGKGPDA